MENKRKRYGADFKFKVALEAVKERQTMSELTAKYGVHSTQIGQWKKQLLDEGLDVFKEPGKAKRTITRS
jgi:transposase